MTGVFIIKGMSFNTSELTIEVDEAGKPSIGRLSFEIAYDACIAWARIAIQHRDDARTCMSKRIEVWERSENETEKAISLIEEFQSSMQAIVAAATCIDALYDHVFPFASIGDDTRDAWAKKGTARYRQVAETFRSAFRIKPEENKHVIEQLKAIYHLRDISVHPSSAANPPYPHPHLGTLMDWRFTVFRGDVADMIATNSLRLLWDVTRGNEYRSAELTRFMSGFRTRVDELLPNGKPTSELQTVTFTVPSRRTRG